MRETKGVKAKCAVCFNEDFGMCSIKNCKIKINKSRKCKGFIYDHSKIKVKTKIPSKYVPYWYTDKNLRKAKLIELKNKELKKSAKQYLTTSDSPDCLAAFRSSAK